MNTSDIEAAAWFLAAIAILMASRVAIAGPPFLTDDPEPIEYWHSEAYVFSTRQKGPDGKQYQLPAFDNRRRQALHLSELRGLLQRH